VLKKWLGRGLVQNSFTFARLSAKCVQQERVIQAGPNYPETTLGFFILFSLKIQKLINYG
jgi:hypothetical protein